MDSLDIEINSQAATACRSHRPLDPIVHSPRSLPSFILIVPAAPSLVRSSMPVKMDMLSQLCSLHDAEDHR